jgi:hypothetical protein
MKTIKLTKGFNSYNYGGETYTAGKSYMLSDTKAAGLLKTEYKGKKVFSEAPEEETKQVEKQEGKQPESQPAKSTSGKAEKVKI